VERTSVPFHFVTVLGMMPVLGIALFFSKH